MGKMDREGGMVMGRLCGRGNGWETDSEGKEMGEMGSEEEGDDMNGRDIL